jgi:hypothetical protein
MRIPFHKWYCLTIAHRAGASRLLRPLAVAGRAQARPWPCPGPVRGARVLVSPGKGLKAIADKVRHHEEQLHPPLLLTPGRARITVTDGTPHSAAPPSRKSRRASEYEGQLTRRVGVSVAGQHAVELAAGADVGLGEDLAQVVLDRARADEQPGADLRVGRAVPGQPRDLGLLGGQRVAG